jgi:hypothetical protein
VMLDGVTVLDPLFWCVAKLRIWPAWVHG